MNPDSGWKVALTVFNTVLLVELGGMAQLTTLYFSAESPKVRLWVFLGAGVALLLCAAIGVVAGAWIGGQVAQKTFHVLAGVALIVLGLWSFRLALG
jgi:putative Ca2+/H+ antiporter (TMEM165/GDT1 family)